jgi:hypothetical protein
MPVDKIPSAGIDSGGVAPSNLSTGAPSWTTSGNLVLQGGNTSANGIGVTFPATQSASTDANTLDDYEEGTYTPNVYHASSNNSTWTSKQGQYTRIGNQVTVWGVCDGGNSGTAGSALRIDLPFVFSGYSNCAAGTATFNGTGANSIALQLFNGFLYVNVRAIGGDYTSQVTYIGFFATYTV